MTTSSTPTPQLSVTSRGLLLIMLRTRIFSSSPVSDLLITIAANANASDACGNSLKLITTPIVHRPRQFNCSYCRRDPQESWHIQSEESLRYHDSRCRPCFALPRVRQVYRPSRHHRHRCWRPLRRDYRTITLPVRRWCQGAARGNRMGRARQAYPIRR